jgi:hypothetical protein
MNQPFSKSSQAVASLPRERPPIPQISKGTSPQELDWIRLVAQTVHPTKVAVIEALLWIGEPLSASELNQMLGESTHGISLLQHHLRALVRLKVLEVAAHRRARGAVESYYYFTEA